MKFSNRIFYFFLFTLIFLLIACNSPSPDDGDNILPTLAATAVNTSSNPEPESNTDAAVDTNPAVEETQEQVEEAVEQVVEEVAEPEVEPESETNTQPAGLSEGVWTADARLIPFDTFEFGYRIETTSPDGATQFIALSVLNSKPDSITLWRPSAQGFADSQFYNEVQLGVFEDSSFMYSPQTGCIWSNEGGTNDEMLGFNTDSFLLFDEQPDAQFVGMETINGLETFAYEVGQQTLTNDLPSGVQVVEANGRFNIYQTPEGEQLIVRSSMQMISNYNFFTESFSANPDTVMTFTSEITNINQPIEVAVPAECDQQANNFPYPLYPGGFVQASMPELAVVQVTGASKAEIAEWYQTEMVNAGWTQTGSQDLGQLIMLNFEMNGQAISINIVDDPSSGGVAVTFMGN